ncbi:MAG: sensor histidine kinase, partial [Chitinophagaceae bacterium]
AIVYIFLGFLLFLLDSQVGNRKKQALLLQKSREAELQFLRSQINPHFLFNTLNNIYSLVYEQSDKAPAAMLRLSDMMRYMLYEKKETVPLAKEWDYISSFVELQKLRFHEEPAIVLTAEGNLDAHLIPPYLLIPFVENAFKHGDLRDAADPLTITLAAGDGDIRFRVQNKISHRNKDESGGVGLDNVRRRLELIFPGRHTLQTGSDGRQHAATLILKL